MHSFANKLALIDMQKQRILALKLRDWKYIHVKQSPIHFLKNLLNSSLVRKQSPA